MTSIPPPSPSSAAASSASSSNSNDRSGYRAGYRGPAAAARLQPPESGRSGRSADTKDLPLQRGKSGDASGAAHAAERRVRGRGNAGLLEASRLLSDRDLAVLQIVHDHRFLSTTHVQGFLFFDHASHRTANRICQRVLSRLEGHGLLVRPIRRIGGTEAGSVSTIWMLTSQGQRLLSLRAGLGAIGRVREPGEGFVRHYLAIADTHLSLVEAERLRRFELLDVAIEPASWRRYPARHGGTVTLKPDLFAAAAGPQYEAHFYIEVDRATESIPTVLKQCHFYEDYRRSGFDQDDSGLFPRVLWAVPDQQRAGKLRAAIDRDRHLDGELFIVTTIDSLADVVTAETHADAADEGGEA